MNTGKVIMVCMLASVLTTAAGHFLMQALSQQGVLTPEEISTPLLVGLAQQEAQRMVESSSLQFAVSGQRVDANMEEGKVVSQTPVASVKVLPNSLVQVVISSGKGQVMIPDTRGLDLEIALKVLSSAGLKTGPIERRPHQELARDHIISTRPIAGEMAAPDTMVALLVSTGPT